MRNVFCSRIVGEQTLYNSAPSQLIISNLYSIKISIRARHPSNRATKVTNCQNYNLCIIRQKFTNKLRHVVRIQVHYNRIFKNIIDIIDKVGIQSNYSESDLFTFPLIEDSFI